MNNKQNGFQKNRSFEDHLFTLSPIIRNRKDERLFTYIAFVDFEKAFDCVDRNLLFFKPKSMGFDGEVSTAIESIYSSCLSTVYVNGYLTEKFPINLGVCQRDGLSSTHFGLYINDLAKALNASGQRIKLYEDLIIALLLYADDLAILAESKEDLQMLLNILEKWCKQWHMRVNIKKTKIVHFRTKTQSRTDFNFMFNNEIVECVYKYKYLGIILDKHLDFNITATVLTSSASRALGSIYNKFAKLKGLCFSTFIILYHLGVVPILGYCAGI